MCDQPFSPYVPSGVKAWTPDYCAVVAFGALRRTGNSNPITDDEIPSDGLFQPATLHANRLGFNVGGQSRNTDELCKPHIGRVAFLNGRCVPIACTVPVGDSLKLVAAGAVMVNRGQIDNRIARSGYACAIMRMDTPRTAEVFFSTAFGVCGVPT